MDLQAIIDSVEELAHHSDAANADRVLLVYLTSNDSGVYVHRVGRGTHRLVADGDFRDCLTGAVDKLWPECSKGTRNWLRIAADFIARSPFAKMLGGSSGAKPPPTED